MYALITPNSQSWGSTYIKYGDSKGLSLALPICLLNFRNVASFRNWSTSNVKIRSNFVLLIPVLLREEWANCMSHSDNKLSVLKVKVLDFPHIIPFQNLNASKATSVSIYIRAFNPGVNFISCKRTWLGFLQTLFLLISHQVFVCFKSLYIAAFGIRWVLTTRQSTQASTWAVKTGFSQPYQEIRPVYMHASS